MGFMPIEAASAGADHLRDRFWFVADAASQRRDGFGGQGKDGITQRGGRGSMADTSGEGLAKRERERGVLREVGGESKGQDAAHDGCALANANSGRFGKPGKGEIQQSRRTEAICRGNPSWIIGHDGKARRVEPSIRLLADGIPARVGKLRALGNAIDPRPAAAFITAYMQARGMIVPEEFAA